MKQGENGWLLAGAEGSYEFSRAYYLRLKNKDEPEYIVAVSGSSGGSRLGPSHLWAMDLTDKGMELTWSCGRRSFIPTGWFQATYR